MNVVGATLALFLLAGDAPATAVVDVVDVVEVSDPAAVPAPPPPADQPPSLMSSPSPSPSPSASSAEEPAGPLAGCADLARRDPEAGEGCFAGLAAGADVAVARDAAEALRVLGRLRRHRPATTTESPPLTLSSAWLHRGSVEAGLHGVVLGATAGFVGASAVLAALRTSEAASLPWLVVTPAVTGLIGGAAAIGGAAVLDAEVDDISFVASTTWAGLGLATLLQFAVLAESGDVAAPAVGLTSILAGATAGLGAGLVLAPTLDVTSGDAALANSALVWGGTLGFLGAGVFGNATGGLSLGQGTLIMATGSGLAWLGAMAAHPFVELHRVSTWIIDAGGVAGLLLGASAAVVVSSAGSTASWGAVLGGTALGLATGAGLAIVVDDAFADDPATNAPPPMLSLAPGVVRAPGGGVAPGVVVEVARW